MRQVALWLIPTILATISATAQDISSQSDTTMRAINDAAEKVEIISQLNGSLRRIGSEAEIQSCDAMYDYIKPMPSGHDTSFGAICTLKSGTKLLMCDDRLVGKFTVTESFAWTKEWIGRFVENNCPPGG